MPKRVLLTGSTGMVGQNLLENPDFLENDITTPLRDDLDLLDADAVESFIQETKPEVVVHVAGRVGGIAANLANQASFLFENLSMGMNLMRACADLEHVQFLNLASSCVYPREAENPLREDLLFTGPLEPTNEGYALAKLAVLRMGEFLDDKNPGFRCVSLLPCNLYGRWDHFEPERSHLIAAIVCKLHDAKLRGLEEVDIWGDGTVRREFMFASDLADFLVLALREFEDLPPRVNVGCGQDHSVNEYYEAVRDVVGYSGRFTHDLSRPVGMRQKLVDIEAQSLLGWKPSTSLNEGIANTYKFFLEHNG